MNLKIFTVILSIIVIIASCNVHHLEEKHLDLSVNEVMPIDSLKQITIVNLLHSYSVSESDTKKGYFNLYVCKLLDNDDSILVFNKRDSHRGNSISTENQGQNFVINKSNIRIYSQRSVSIKVTDGFKMPRNVKYIFAEIEDTFD